MLDIKRSIILEEGTSILVYNALSGSVGVNTTALIGRASKQSMGDVSLESHRQIQLVPEVEISNGYNVQNLVTGENYLVVAKFPEVIMNEVCSYIVRAVKCNTKLYASRLEEVADKYGNISKSFVSVYEPLNVHTEAKGSQSISKAPGEYIEAKHTLYAPSIDVQDTDRIELLVNGVKVPFKLTGKDLTSFEGISVLELETDTRR